MTAALYTLLFLGVIYITLQVIFGPAFAYDGFSDALSDKNKVGLVFPIQYSIYKNYFPYGPAIHIVLTSLLFLPLTIVMLPVGLITLIINRRYW